MNKSFNIEITNELGTSLKLQSNTGDIHYQLKSLKNTLVEMENGTYFLDQIKPNEIRTITISIHELEELS